MLKTLCIFGDSFSSTQAQHEKQNWASILEKDYSWIIKNYAVGGGGIDYSYWKFLQTHHNHNHIIFVASHIYRKTLFSVTDDIQSENILSCIKKMDVDAVYASYGKIDTALYHINNKITSPDTSITIEHDIEKWVQYKFANDILAYHAILTSVKAIRPDAKIIHAFDTFEKNCFYNISTMDYKKFKTKKDQRVTRPNHMSLLQNQQVADNIDKYLTGVLDFNDTLDPNNVNNYYTVSETLEEAGLII